ncbi:MAG: hypothetical protein ACJAZ1_000065 [Yoonia sp.]|jgi:hypothetical protein
MSAPMVVRKYKAILDQFEGKSMYLPEALQYQFKNEQG